MSESNFNDKNERDESQTEEVTGKIEYGIFSGPGIVNELVPFREVDGYAIAEGDIILGTVEELRNPDPNVLEQNEKERVRDSENDTAAERGTKFGLVMAESRYRWPNKTMPYEIDPNLPNQSRIQPAMEHITSKTGFKFVKRTNQADFVHFQFHQSSTSSRLGKVGGKQIINVADWARTGNLIHEILHAMGVYHEACRPDRDNYIKIHWANLADGWASQYAKPVGALPISTYDYCSIMHYGSSGGAKQGLKAFDVLRPASCTIGQRQGLSEKDIHTIKRIYT